MIIFLFFPSYSIPAPDTLRSHDRQERRRILVQDTYVFLPGLYLHPISREIALHSLDLLVICEVGLRFVHRDDRVFLTLLIDIGKHKRSQLTIQIRGIQITGRERKG